MFRDIAGQRFGRLLVLVKSEHRWKNNVMWYCICDCGTEKLIPLPRLRSGHAVSCGCRYRERNVGLRKLPEYAVWATMRSRCMNPNCINYRDYGGRGISVCDRWLKFSNFFADMGRRPTAKHTIERRDNNGNYDPANCYWATRLEQALNTRRTQCIKFDGVVYSRLRLARMFNISPQSLQLRLDRGMDIESAIEDTREASRRWQSITTR